MGTCLQAGLPAFWNLRWRGTSRILCFIPCNFWDYLSRLFRSRLYLASHRSVSGCPLRPGTWIPVFFHNSYAESYSCRSAYIRYRTALSSVGCSLSVLLCGWSHSLLHLDFFSLDDLIISVRMNFPSIVLWMNTAKPSYHPPPMPS